jgi:hypothetical protein
MNTADIFAFFGTGECIAADQRNAALGQLAILIIGALLIALIYKHAIKGRRTGEKLAGYLAIVFVLAVGLGVIGFIHIGVACSG